MRGPGVSPSGNVTAGTASFDQRLTANSRKPSFLLSAVGPHGRQLRIIQPTHLLTSDGQQLRMLRGHERADTLMNG